MKCGKCVMSKAIPRDMALREWILIRTGLVWSCKGFILPPFPIISHSYKSKCVYSAEVLGTQFRFWHVY